MAAAGTKYIEGIGRRKESVARVRIVNDKKGDFVINDKTLQEYFPQELFRHVAAEALNKVEKKKDFSVSVKISGGGVSSQAESIRLGTARALVKYEAELRGDLKKEGFLKRDPRVKERKKFGLKKARKAAQWSKR